MRKIINSFFGSIITTLAILIGSFLLMMFSSGQNGIRKTYFDTLFFESITRPDGSVGVHFGLTGEILPIIITIIIFFVFYYVIFAFNQNLDNYKGKE